MYRSTLQGTQEGSIITIGSTLFLVCHNWSANSEIGYTELRVQSNSNERIYTGLHQTAIGFKEPDADWVLCENEAGLQIVELTLNVIDRDKKKRLPYDTFEPLRITAYRNALQEELNKET